MTLTVRLPKFPIPDAEDALLRAGRALFRVANEIIADSKANYVPVDTGTLRSTGAVQIEGGVGGGRVTVTLGFGGPAAPYALFVHENPRSGKTGGVSPSGQKYRRYAKVGQFKYLEIPFNQRRRDIPGLLAAAISKARRNAR